MKYFLPTLVTLLALGCSGNLVKYDLKNDQTYNTINKINLPNNKNKSLYYNKRIYFNPIDTELLNTAFYEQTKKQIDSDFNNIWSTVFDRECKIAKSTKTKDNADFIFTIKVIRIRTENPFELWPYTVFGKRIKLWIYVVDKFNNTIFSEKLNWIYDNQANFIYLANEISIMLNSER